MRPSRISEVLDGLLDSRWPAMIWGPPGVGKSSIVHTVAARRSLPVVDIRAALLDPTDIRGIPAIENGRAVWCPPSFLPSETDEPGVLFFDELSSAPPLVQASLYQLTLDRRVGEYRLPDGWRIVAAGNRAEDRSISFRMPAALSNRFIHLDFELDYGDWRDWAIRHDVHPLVTAFLGFRPELLLDMRQTDRGFPTPRSWVIASDAITQFARRRTAAKESPAPPRAMKNRAGSMTSVAAGIAAEITDIQDVLLGILGEGTAVEFVAYCRSSADEETMRRVLADPQNASLPGGLGATYALISYLIARCKERSVQDAAGTLLGRLSPEMAVLLMNDIAKVVPGFLFHAGAQRFVRANASLIAP